jgi:hypothetical protein
LAVAGKSFDEPKKIPLAVACGWLKKSVKKFGNVGSVEKTQRSDLRILAM